MPDVATMFYHGIREQVRRVIGLLGEERVDKGLTAFEDGGNNWSECFFARALAPARLRNEFDVCEALNLRLTDGRWNVVPVRIVYRTFDNASTMISADGLKQMIIDIRDESRPDGVMEFLKSINYTDVERTPVAFSGTSCAVGDDDPADAWKNG